VLRDRLPRDVEAAGDLADRELAPGEEPEQLAPARLGEHLEDVGGHCGRK